MSKKKRKQRNKRKKHKQLVPRRKRMRRQARLVDARAWLSTYSGRNVVRGYARWYGVDLHCAIVELRTLGVKVSEDYAAQIERSHARRTQSRAQRRGADPVEEECRVGWLEGWDEYLVYESYDLEGEGGEIPVADPDAWLGDELGSRGADEELPIEYAFLSDIYALDLKVIDTLIEESVGDEEGAGVPSEGALIKEEHAGVRPMWMRIELEEDPDVLAPRAWSLIYVLGVLSYASARPQTDAGNGGGVDVDKRATDEWTIDDMLRRLAFERGRLSFHADDVRGRCMHTTIEIDPDGKITVETVGRGRAAKRWIAKLLGKRVTPPDPEGARPDPIPF